MPTEVVSPVTRKGSKVGSPNLGLSPGARSMPGARRDSTVPQPPKDEPLPRPSSRGDSFSSVRVHGEG
jgi:hypothetical protein